MIHPETLLNVARTILVLVHELDRTQRQDVVAKFRELAEESDGAADAEYFDSIAAAIEETI